MWQGFHWRHTPWDPKATEGEPLLQVPAQGGWAETSCPQGQQSRSRHQMLCAQHCCPCWKRGAMASSRPRGDWFGAGRLPSTHWAASQPRAQPRLRSLLLLGGRELSVLRICDMETRRAGWPGGRTPQPQAPGRQTAHVRRGQPRLVRSPSRAVTSCTCSLVPTPYHASPAHLSTRFVTNLGKGKTSCPRKHASTRSRWLPAL